MNETALKLMEYDKIKDKLAEYAVSEAARALIQKLLPGADIGLIQSWMEETTQMRSIVDRNSSVPIHSMECMGKIMGKLGKGGVLLPEELTSIGGFLSCTGRLKGFMRSMESVAPGVAAYARSMDELENLADEIRRCIEYDRISDRAGPELSKLRKKIAIAEERVRHRLESILKSSAYSAYIQDAVVSTRNGRFVIPVKREHRKNLDGNVLDTSASGSTVFIEPAAVKKLQEELNVLHLEEENEELRILSYLTGIVEAYQRELSIDMEAMLHYDFLTAKAKYSRALDGRPVDLNTHGRIVINGGRHPLIGNSAVPLDFEIGDSFNALVITGPNTGGKTVALKTVGLHTMMAQSGLHVPLGEGSTLAVFEDILADIGDGQSIEQSLSTFSSHITNILRIIRRANAGTLVIIDELGAGTDPGEGMGLAAAVLEEVHAKGATIIATTHYSELKTLAREKVGFENGCMEFDINTLKPLYRLKIGEAGESNAFLIALRLGMDRKIIERAHRITYKQEKDYGRLEESLRTAADTGRAKPTDEAVTAAFKPAAAAGGKKAAPGKTGHAFKIGDCVFISSMKRTGIVCELENSRGDLGVMVMKKKLLINRKRLSLYVDGSELYPDNYDFDIVFESKENRKRRHQMGRKHVEGLVIESPSDNKADKRI